MMATDFPTCVVNEPVGMVLSFPKLDAEAGAPFIGTWNSVAVTDGTDFYGMDLLGMSMTVALKDDGTGTVDMDDDATLGGWYVENGAAVFAPILEEGGRPATDEAMPFTLDENGRMCLDLSGLIVLMEKEGAEYAVPAIPEKPWPELDTEKAKLYVGTWDAVSYVVDGQTVSAELAGPTTLILNADGTAQMIEGEEEAYELRWYAESYSAYVGPAMSALAELYFDMNGDLQMKQEDSKIIMKPHVEAKVIEGADELLGDWYDDLGNKLTLTNDGSMTVTYASDGWVRELKWDMVDGVATVTEGLWVGCPIVLEDGIVIISGDNAFQLFSADGDLSAYYGEEELPEAQPIGPEGEPYFGSWKGAMFGMEVILTLNQDGTCAMEMMGESEPGVWSIVDGKANIMGDESFIDGDGNLVMPSAEMVLTRAGAEQPAAGSAIDYVPSVADDFIGGWICKADPNMQLLLLEGEANLIDGSELYTVDWSVVDGVAEFDGMKLYITDNYTIGILDMYGEQVEFERGYVEKPKAAAPSNTGAEQVSGSDASGLSEALKPYVGTWHMVYIATGGLEGDLRTMGVTAKLELNADGTGKLSGAADDSGKWYDDEGTVRFGQGGSPLVLLDGGFLRYGNQLAGYMVFSQDAAATWSPASAAPVVPSATAAPTAAPQAPAGGNVQYVGQKYVCKTYTTFGQTMDASMLGAEYALKFGADNMAEFTLAGFTVPFLPYTVNAEGVYVINYYGTMFNCVPTATGFDMDYYGTMTMHFVPAE